MSGWIEVDPRKALSALIDGDHYVEEGVVVTPGSAPLWDKCSSHIRPDGRYRIRPIPRSTRLFTTSLPNWAGIEGDYGRDRPRVIIYYDHGDDAIAAFNALLKEQKN